VSNGLPSFAGQKYLNFESYRRSGKPVRTPLWFVESGGFLYVRTPEDTGKVKRIRRNPRVRIVVSDVRGRPKGDWMEARARIAEGAEAAQANRLLSRKYGLVKRLIDFGTRLRGRGHIVIALEV
jgi:hypothetical protein